MDFVESYLDRAVLSDVDWVPYARPQDSKTPFGILRANTQSSFSQETYAAQLTPVLVKDVSNPNVVIRGNSLVDVWLQFWTSRDMLTLIVWYIRDAIRWPDGTFALPSAFEMPEACPDFLFNSIDPELDIPDCGFLHAGGQRPAPWPLPPGAVP